MSKMLSRVSASTIAVALVLGSAAYAQAQTPAAPSAVADPAVWPKVTSKWKLDPAVERRVDAILATMSLEDKVAQIIQPDIASVKPEDLKEIRLGSILNGGNSAPGGNEEAPAIEWLKLADAFYDASMSPRADGKKPIPVIWGTDSVHGNNNIVGATLFPHNIGLGSARDPDLIRRIGRITALETAAAGIDWTFAPTLAVVQDDRWGRTYESYSEEPEIVAQYAGAMIEGIQGKVGTPEFMAPDRVISTTKHFLADGGTGGRDQGDARIPEKDLVDIHNAGYPPAIEAGTLTAMASFSSWNGVKMTGNKSLLTDVLKDRMGFNGFTVGDWNAHAQVPGCAVESCAAAINAGLDMFMVSGDWKALYRNTLAQAKSGELNRARLDDAVRRILRVKVVAGTFDRGRPSARKFGGKLNLLGAPEHLEVAREAVRKSMVLLKNEGGVLPIKPGGHILVAGTAADSISQAAGGWSITWQGIDVPNTAFPNGQTILQGIREANKGGRVSYSPGGGWGDKPDAAIVVFGEKPYAEFVGDRPNLEFSPEDKAHLEMLRKLKAAGIPTVAVFLSGRPMWVNAEINASDAFVAAFLPGSQGRGVGDVLFRKEDGSVNHDFVGKLSFSWPKRPDQMTLNRRDANYDPLFPFGYGLSYASGGSVPRLDETRPAGLNAGSGPLFANGRVPEGWTISLMEEGQSVNRLLSASGATQRNWLSVAGVDRNAQEDSRRLTWTGAADFRIEARQPIDITRETNGELSLVVDYRVDAKPTGPVQIGLVSGETKRVTVPVTGAFASAPVGEWRTLAVPLLCFARAGLDPAQVTAPFVIGTTGPATISISSVRYQQISGVPTTRCAL